MTADEGECEPSEGTYLLLIRLTNAATIVVGSLEEIRFEPGAYAYVGSAFGPGGFTRLDRHRAVATGNRDVRHWHIDFLLAHDAATVVEDRRVPGCQLECALSRRLDPRVITDFGATDCQCRSHLAYYPTVRELQHAVTDEIQYCLS